MKTSDFDYELPSDRIALEPADPKDSARLLVIAGDQLSDRHIRDLPDLLHPGDVLVLNDTKVIPARLIGTRPSRQPNGQPASIEVTLHKALSGLEWAAFAKPAKRLAIGDVVEFNVNLSATVTEKMDGGEITLLFDGDVTDLMARLHQAGTMPLPPYIASKRSPNESDLRKYQTVYARVEGAVAAPTAGLHLSDAMLDRLRREGIEFAFLTLHVGAGTFLPVKVDDVSDHQMHSEWGDLSTEAADQLNAARQQGRRLIAVGTTSLRLLETAVDSSGTFTAFHGETDIFITPGYNIRSADLLMTNFHLPKSTLLMLIHAFGGIQQMKRAYDHAIRNNYRFYSYGDACLIERAAS